uniref:Putative ovule protein n=1 Tax=Solanum chacoense TaxID=4108 RepID=A0A0V0IAA4_SOLCH
MVINAYMLQILECFIQRLHYKLACLTHENPQKRGFIQCSRCFFMLVIRNLQSPLFALPHHRSACGVTVGNATAN